MIRVTFLGTAAARPTVRRGVSAIFVQREGDAMLFDCGEGTQRQMMRFTTGFGIDRIFVTHLHADHFLGVTGLVRTMSLQGREDPISVYGPPGSSRTLRAAVELGVERVGFEVRVHEMEPGEAVLGDEYEIRAFAVQHGGRALGYALVEQDRLGRFDVDKARELGIPEGPLFGLLHRGETIEVEGRTIDPAEVVGEAREGRTVVYTGDTLPGPWTVDAARGANLLIHEATFGEDEADRARDTKHSTASQAAQVAREADVRRLVLTHLSARYSDDPEPLEQEARTIFEGAVVARDGLTIELPYNEDEDAEDGGSEA
jgi:ribonuclease Z